MERRRYVLRYRGEGAKPEGDAERVRRLTGATVIDETPRMMLVESDDEEMQTVAGTLSGWIVAPEREISLPKRPDTF